MYALVDRPVTELDSGGQLLVWAMRSWVVAIGRRQCPGATVGRGFAGRGMIAGLQPFLRMMALLNRGGLDNFEFCQLACNHVSEHEAIFLSLVNDMRGGQATAVRGTLDLLVEDEFAGGLFDAILDLAKALDRAGLATTIPKGR